MTGIILHGLPVDAKCSSSWGILAIGTVAVGHIVLLCGLSMQESSFAFLVKKLDPVSTMKHVEVFNLRSSCFPRAKTGIQYIKLCIRILRGPRL